MLVARCCAAIPKQRDFLMLSYTLGFPMQRDSLMLSCKLGFPIQREVLMLSYKQGFTHAERRPHAVIQDGLQS